MVSLLIELLNKLEIIKISIGLILFPPAKIWYLEMSSICESCEKLKLKLTLIRCYIVLIVLLTCLLACKI